MNYHTIYHITNKSNLPNILNEHCLKSSIGAIYACPTYHDALKFLAFSGKWVIDDCVILKLHLPSHLPIKWEKSLDHNPKYIPADAIIYRDTRLYFTDADIIEFQLN